jgi:uncharacterized protein
MSLESLRGQANKARRIRTDAGIYIPSGSQMGTSDPLANQLPFAATQWEPNQLSTMVEGIWFCRRIANVMSEEPVKNWFNIEFTPPDDDLAYAVQQYLEQLHAKQSFQHALFDEVVYGDGLIGMGIQAAGKGVADPTTPVEPDKIKEILYLENISRDDRFTGIELEADANSPNYGNPKAYVIKQGDKEITVDASRMIHFQTRPRIKSSWGLSFFTPIWSVVQVVENTVWSLGQMAYNMATRVVTSQQLNEGAEKRLEFMEELETRINSLSMLVMGENESVSTVSNSPGSLKWFVDFVWDLASAATQINRASLLGAQAGVLASSESDLRRYYEFIAARQRNYVEPALRKLINLVLATDTIGKRGQELSYEIEFNSLETPSREEELDGDVKEADRLNKEATAFQSLSQALMNLADLGVVDPDAIAGLLSKVREGEIGNRSLMEQLFAEE